MSPDARSSSQHRPPRAHANLPAPSSSPLARLHSLPLATLTTASACFFTFLSPAQIPEHTLISPVTSSTAQVLLGPQLSGLPTLVGLGQHRGLYLEFFMSEEGKELPKEATLPTGPGQALGEQCGSTGSALYPLVCGAL